MQHKDQVYLDLQGGQRRFGQQLSGVAYMILNLSLEISKLILLATALLVCQ